jgi:hypothetical protein
MKRKKKKIILKVPTKKELEKKVRKSLTPHLSRVRVVPDKKTIYERKPKHPPNGT